MAKAALATVLLALAASVSLAHSPVDRTTPEDGSVLMEAPSHIVLNFDRQIRLTRVQVAGGDGATTDLDLEGQKRFTDRFEVPLKDMGSGLYRIEWRGLSPDGHVMRNEFTFRVE